MWRAIFRFLDKAKRWVRYAYFLRFSLALWLFAPLMCLLDRTGAKTLTSGIMTPETLQQFICVAFFLVSAGFVALICARVVLINGPERWDKCYDERAFGNERNDGRPPSLAALLANNEGRKETWAILLSQLPNFGVYIYLYVNGTGQLVSSVAILLGLLIGSVVGLAAWYVVNAWYYLTYDAPAPTGKVLFGKNAARTLLFPRWAFGFGSNPLRRPGTNYSPNTIEGASTWLKNRWVDRLLQGIAQLFDEFNSPGYVYRAGGERRLFEGHIFGAQSALMCLALYLTLWPLTAPVPALYSSIAVLLVLAAICVALCVVIWKPADREHPPVQPLADADLTGVAEDAPPATDGLRTWKISLTLALWAFYGVFVGLYFLSSAERFPIFATILIIVIALCWILSGIAFFLDLYRVPVFTVFVIAMIVPRIFHLDGGREEHYLSAITGAEVCCSQIEPDDVPVPRDLVNKALNANGGEDAPLIIVTATGGGLHASAWTAQILDQLQKRFDQPAAGTFQKHLLLVSSVSGGSLGLLSYLTALREKPDDEQPDFKPMLISSQCSSLEAVGWGLVYWDMSKAIVPLLPYLFAPSSGLDDLDETPLGKDRTWSLRKGFARNTRNNFCNDTWNRDNSTGSGSVSAWLDNNFKAGNRLQENRKDERLNENVEKDLTLRQLKPRWDKSPIPAFSMNTTSFEDGQRFLLANYKIPNEAPDTPPNYRARSFIETYKTIQGSDGKFRLADLPLATAAQLSATFPYISSAARVPLALDHGVQAVHFVDGGYYDNDGTSSVIEFLRYALDPCPQAIGSPERATCQDMVRSAALDPASHPLHIILIEIRNSGDDYGSEPENNRDHTSATEPSNLLSQLGAPLTAFWQAGHESITARTRVALAQLEHAFSGRLVVHRIVFADNQSTTEVGTDPLSWSLTPKQRLEVRNSAVSCEMEKQYQEALAWFRMKPEDWKKSGGDSDWPESIKPVVPSQKQ